MGVVSSFKLRTQWLKMLLYLIIDVATLRNLCALPPMLGQLQNKPFSQARKTVAAATDLMFLKKRSVGAPPPEAVHADPSDQRILGGKLTAFHGYNLKQLILMVNPTSLA